MSNKKEKGKNASLVVSIGFLLTFLFSNVILLVLALSTWLSDRRQK